METFSTWSNELDVMQSVDVRGPSADDQTWVTDYLIGCHIMSQPHNPALAVFVGSNEGNIALMSTSDRSPAAAPWSLHRSYIGGHNGVVRSILWDEAVCMHVVTGGEDSKLNAWPNVLPDPSSVSKSTAMDVDADADTENTLSRKRVLDSGIARDPEQSGKKRRT
jgi:hypothetical protein